MKNPIKMMGVVSAAALLMAAGIMGCASHYQKGQTAFKNKDFDRAIAEFTEEIRSNPRNWGAYLNRGAAYALKENLERPEDLERAIADLEKSLKIKPNNSHATDILERLRRQLAELTATQTANTGSPPAYTPYTPVAQSAPAAPTPQTAAADDELDIAIRDASDYLNDNIPERSKIVILNIESNAANLSEYIIDELIANAVNDKRFSVVDRRQLEAIQSEQKFQMSGAVDDKDALAIGKFFGAQTIISGAMRDIGPRYRLTIRALSVQTAQVQGQYNRNMAVSEMLAGLAGSGGAWSRPSAAAGGRTTQTVQSAAIPRATSAAPAIRGTPVEGNNLTGKLKWLEENAESGGTYLIELNANETIAPATLAYEGKSKITITITGVGGNRSVFLSSDGSMFTVSSNVTLILENNVTLEGRSPNDKALVFVNGGTLRMNAGAAITGNTGYNGSGVYIQSSGTFTMNGGSISGNTANLGGGVRVYEYGVFTMNGGTISDNTANTDGGGVYCDPYARFFMNGGIITGNNAGNQGGGAYVYSSIYEITTFNKEGGSIITGYASDADNGNRALSGNKSGHAVYFFCKGSDDKRKETTAGPSEKLKGNCGRGAWD